MSASHTPGPWLIDENRWDGAVTIINDGHEPVLSAAWEGGSQTSLRVSEADLRLIAAAPALLEALEARLRFDEEPDQGTVFDQLRKLDELEKMARAAVALAKGESA